ncbi:MAG TPA: hypothetical protein VN605_00200, partial [Thermoanaerobaculia bacterium]|nr:hypothetical protein [Thermoanaerobaculia bacterium]
MPWLGTITVIGVVVLAALVILFVKTRSRDLLEELMNKRRGGSILVSRAEYVEGMERIPVALALTSDTFYYENPDLEARFELDRIDEIEYDDELSTGRPISDGCRVLRLRSHGTTFDFVLGTTDCQKW